MSPKNKLKLQSRIPFMPFDMGRSENYMTMCQKNRLAYLVVSPPKSNYSLKRLVSFGFRKGPITKKSNFVSKRLNTSHWCVEWRQRGFRWLSPAASRGYPIELIIQSKLLLFSLHLLLESALPTRAPLSRGSFERLRRTITLAWGLVRFPVPSGT